MNNNKKEYKISFYDKFKCTADKCSLTCCSGWDIAIDNTTYEKWNEHGISYCSLSMSNDLGRIIKKETAEDCPFLDKDKLCHIVKDNGDEYLSETCRTFPRIINGYDERNEVSLSCACPEVVELISRESKIDMQGGSLSSESCNLDIREILINIINNDDFSLEYNLVLCYSMMNELLAADNKKDADSVKQRYKDKSYLNELAEYYKSIKQDLFDSLDELNSLFIDITENYRNVKLLQKMLENVCVAAETIDLNDIAKRYHDFRKHYEDYDEFNNKCIITKIYNMRIDADYTTITVNLEMIILEYILGRYAVFLKSYIDNGKDILIEDVKEAIAVFSRIISSNYDAVKEFIADGFGSEILDIGYVCFISLM